VERVKSTFPNGLNLSGLRVVLDCANGASYRAAPEVLWELGAEVIALGVSPDGHNINDGVGSTARARRRARIRDVRGPMWASASTATPTG
jgi:phosphoglucosamine mutase